MASKGKKQKLTVVGTVLTIEYPTIKKRIVTDTARYPDEVQFAAKMHGFKQKYGDVESGGTPSDKYEGTLRVIAAHENGSWDVESRVVDNTPFIVAAIARMKGVTEAEVRKAAGGDTEEAVAKIKEWGTNQKVKAEILQIKAERAAAAAEVSDEEELDIDL